MRVASLFGVALFAGSVWLGACGPPYPGNVYCAGNSKNCSCHDEPNCAYDCPVGGCDIDCHNADNCDLGCGDACKLDCHDAISCGASCGDGCQAECHNATSCDIECGADCSVDCHDNTSCSVTMISGDVNCHGNTSCNIQCLLPGGGTTPADNYKKNHWRC